MPYLRCPICSLLAHVTAAGDTTVIHCPRCRAAQRQSRLRPVEHSLEQLTEPPEQDLKPARY
jgi:tRNA(Ile2) C34 agmatinyltransferase TiaS